MGKGTLSLVLIYFRISVYILGRPQSQLLKLRALSSSLIDIQSLLSSFRGSLASSSENETRLMRLTQEKGCEYRPLEQVEYYGTIIG